MALETKTDPDADFNHESGPFRILSIDSMVRAGGLSRWLQAIARAEHDGEIQGSAAYEPEETKAEKSRREDREERRTADLLVSMAEEVIRRAIEPVLDATDQDFHSFHLTPLDWGQSKIPSIGLKMPTNRSSVSLRGMGAGNGQTEGYTDITTTLANVDALLAEMKANLSTLVTADTPKIGFKMRPSSYGDLGVGSFASLSDGIRLSSGAEQPDVGLRVTPDLATSWGKLNSVETPDAVAGREYDPEFQRMMRGLTAGVSLADDYDTPKIGLKFNGITAKSEELETDLTANEPTRKPLVIEIIGGRKAEADAPAPALN